MANLGFQKSKISGTGVTFVAADVAGDVFPANSRGALLVRNDSAGTITVTVAVPGNTRYGQTQPDVAVPVDAGTTEAIGPFPRDLVDPVDGRVHVTYSAAASVSVAAVQV